jgi:hypothetical protein
MMPTVPNLRHGGENGKREIVVQILDTAVILSCKSPAFLH